MKSKMKIFVYNSNRKMYNILGLKLKLKWLKFKIMSIYPTQYIHATPQY